LYSRIFYQITLANAFIRESRMQNFLKEDNGDRCHQSPNYTR
jgi:hypothetical protein